MGWPLEASRSLFPDWLWQCDEASAHKRPLHIRVQILTGKFKIEFLPTISLTKAFPVAQIRPILHKIVPSKSVLQGMLCIRKMHLFLGSRSERRGARRAPSKRVVVKIVIVTIQRQRL